MGQCSVCGGLVVRILRRGLKEVIRVVPNLISSSKNFDFIFPISAFLPFLTFFNPFSLSFFSDFTAAELLFWFFSSSPFIAFDCLMKKFFLLLLWLLH